MTTENRLGRSLIVHVYLELKNKTEQNDWILQFWIHTSNSIIYLKKKTYHFFVLFSNTTQHIKD